MDPAALAQAAQVVRQGGIIAYPTEAVYGLGCDPLNEQAVLRLLQLKQRDPAMGLILIGQSLSDFAPCIDGDTMSEELRARVWATWPGPVTWLLPATTGCPRWLTGDHDSIAVRVTAHPLVRALCQATGAALVSTSANRSGEPPCRSASEVRAQFQHTLDLILDGETGGQGRPTEIRDALTGQVVRH